VGFKKILFDSFQLHIFAQANDDNSPLSSKIQRAHLDPHARTFSANCISQQLSPLAELFRPPGSQLSPKT